MPGSAASAAWWLTVLWSVTARKSRPCPAARRASSATVYVPSEWTVWACRSPASHRCPGGAGSARVGRRGHGGTSATGGRAGVAVLTVSRQPRPAAGIRCSPIITCHTPSGIGPGRYPGVAQSSVMVNVSLAPPDQPRNAPVGSRQPRSSTPAPRSYASSIVNACPPGGSSTGTYW